MKEFIIEMKLFKNMWIIPPSTTTIPIHLSTHPYQPFRPPKKSRSHTLSIDSNKRENGEENKKGGD